MSTELNEHERITRQRTVEAAIATHPPREDIDDFEAYARGELTLEEVRARIRARERQRNITRLKTLFGWIQQKSDGATLSEQFSQVYWQIGYIVAGLVFFVTWAYCCFTYGFLFGFGLGWLPAAILCLIAIPTWPVIVGVLIYLWTLL